MTRNAYSLSMNLSPKPNTFGGFPSGILYVRYHSRIASSIPGNSLSTSSTSFMYGAHLSSASMTTTFQSHSPSSIMQRTPRTLTGRMSWRKETQRGKKQGTDKVRERGRKFCSITWICRHNPPKMRKKRKRTPGLMIRAPISHTSSGSLSPRQPSASGWTNVGSSQV
eukprot:Pompholyxophrys_punicea_v1_NODE_334_length_2224_cov_2.285846.p2 type:complete len:167 gc:universal NODE_334_length_2224_cov_2.285846:968-1468(+)